MIMDGLGIRHDCNFFKSTRVESSQTSFERNVCHHHQHHHHYHHHYPGGNGKTEALQCITQEILLSGHHKRTLEKKWYVRISNEKERKNKISLERPRGLALCLARLLCDPREIVLYHDGNA